MTDLTKADALGATVQDYIPYESFRDSLLEQIKDQPILGPVMKVLTRFSPQSTFLTGSLSYAIHQIDVAHETFNVQNPDENNWGDLFSDADFLLGGVDVNSLSDLPRIDELVQNLNLVAQEAESQGYAVEILDQREGLHNMPKLVINVNGRRMIEIGFLDNAVEMAYETEKLLGVADRYLDPKKKSLEYWLSRARYRTEQQALQVSCENECLELKPLTIDGFGQANELYTSHHHREINPKTIYTIENAKKLVAQRNNTKAFELGLKMLNYLASLPYRSMKSGRELNTSVELYEDFPIAVEANQEISNLLKMEGLPADYVDMIIQMDRKREKVNWDNTLRAIVASPANVLSNMIRYPEMIRDFFQFPEVVEAILAKNVSVDEFNWSRNRYVPNFYSERLHKYLGDFLRGIDQGAKVSFTEVFARYVATICVEDRDAIELIEGLKWPIGRENELILEGWKQDMDIVAEFNREQCFALYRDIVSSE